MQLRYRHEVRTISETWSQPVSTCGCEDNKAFDTSGTNGPPILACHPVGHWCAAFLARPVYKAPCNDSSPLRMVHAHTSIQKRSLALSCSPMVGDNVTTFPAYGSRMRDFLTVL